MLVSPLNTSHWMNVLSESCGTYPQRPSSKLSTLCAQIRQRFSPLANRPGVHTSVHLTAMGFRCTGNGDTARCDRCALEVSGWTLGMDPWKIHKTQSPRCSFVCDLKSQPLTVALAEENSSTRENTELIGLESPLNTSVEADVFREARRRTFSDWLHRSTPSTDQMINAGWFSCNVGDRTICIHCNISCHNWLKHVDDPWDVHRTISPQCPFVREKLLGRELPRIWNANQSFTGPRPNHTIPGQNNTNPVQFSTLLRPPEIISANENILRLSATLPNDQRMTNSVYSRIKHDETCVTCNKSLLNMDSCNDQMTDIARWFVHCVHRNQFTAGQVYSLIQRFKQAHRKLAENNSSSDNMSAANPTTNSQQGVIQNVRTLFNTIATRLPIPQQLLDRDFNLSTLKRIWGNELRFKDGDSSFEVDLLMACYLFQKQIDYIDGETEKIQTPNVIVAQIREETKRELAEDLARRKAAAQANNSMSSDPCVLCLMQEKRLACVPCGHLATCVPCGQGLRECLIC